MVEELTLDSSAHQLADCFAEVKKELRAHSRLLEELSRTHGSEKVERVRYFVLENIRADVKKVQFIANCSRPHALTIMRLIGRESGFSVRTW